MNTNSTQTASFFKHGQLQDFYGILNYDLTKEPTPVLLIKNIIEFWKSHKQFWFSHSHISVSNLHMIGTMYEPCKNIDVSLLLHYDQIFRHPCEFITHKHKLMAYKFSTILAFNIIHSTYYESMEIWEKVFTLLTIRHNNNINLKNFVLKKVSKLLTKHPTNNLIQRFYKATLMDIHSFKQRNGYQKQPYDCIDITDISDIIVKPDVTDISFPLIKYKKSFYGDVYNIIKDIETDTFAVSISGGVDSMVLSYVMSLVCTTMNKTLKLLHICYNNRDSCNKEIKLLKWWSKQLNSELYVYNINNITRQRNSQLRTIYEDVTRQIRFSFYKYFDCPILLGHNKDDCIENIFSNLSKQIHYDNLFGMKSMSYESDILIVRPFLDIEKTIIVQFADNCNIPHLCDSTPPWSKRGQLRDTLIPNINSFDNKILSGIYKFVKHSHFLENQWKQTFDRWLTTSINMAKFNMIINRDSFFETNFHNLDFWIQLWFGKIMPSRPSNKSFHNLISNIIKNKNNKVALNKYFDAHIDSDYIHIISTSNLYT